MTKLYRLYQFFTFLVFIEFTIVGVGVFALFNLFTSTESVSERKIENGEKMGRNYVRYKNEIYVLLPGDGYHLIAEADSATFRMLDENLDHIAADRFRVYCGRTPIEGLELSKVRLIGQQYFTDGNRTYYCGTESTPKDKSGFELIKSIVQHFAYAAGMGKKPVNYQYPSHEMTEVSGNLKKHTNFISIDDKYAYYKGEIIPNADPVNIRMIPSWRYDRLNDPKNKVYQGYRYFTDGKRVYYGTQPLPIAYQADLHEVHTGRQNQPAYLYSEASGELVAGGVVFPKEHAPYRLFSHNDAHIYQEIWLGANNQLYYYDHFAKEVKLMGQNPLSAQAQEIFPSIWLDNGTIYFLQDSQTVKKGSLRGSSGVSSRTDYTKFKRLENTSKTWQEIGKTQFGAIWQNGEASYYFDKSGSNQMIYESIYHIVDHATIEQILKHSRSSENIRELIRADKLQPVKSATLLTAEQKWSSTTTTSKVLWGLLPIFLIVVFRKWNLKRLNRKYEGKTQFDYWTRPFDIHSGMLFFYKLFPKTYRLHDIEKAVVKLDPIQGRKIFYRATLQLSLKGKAKPVNCKFIASPQSEENARECIKVLEEKLKAAGIKVKLIK